MTTPAAPMGSEQLWDLFVALDSKLAAQPRPLGLLVVGGAAIALLWNPSRLTRDVDVVERIPGVVEQAAAAVAAETEGLSLRWLNDAAMVARPTGLVDQDPTVVYPGVNLTVSVAAARYVLAMKVFAGRVVDRGDLPVLFAAACVASLDEVIDLHREAYPGVSLHASARRTVEQAWTEYAEPRGLPVRPA